MSIGRLGPSGGADYYLRLGTGVEDYFVRPDREAAGQWLGGGAADLGLRGEVGAQAFRAVLEHAGSKDPAGLVEDKLNEEVREVLVQHSNEMQRSNITYTEMFKMVKKKLAKEKGVVL